MGLRPCLEEGEEVVGPHQSLGEVVEEEGHQSRLGEEEVGVGHHQQGAGVVGHQHQVEVEGRQGPHPGWAAQ